MIQWKWNEAHEQIYDRVASIENEHIFGVYSNDTTRNVFLSFDPSLTSGSLSVLPTRFNFVVERQSFLFGINAARWRGWVKDINFH